MAIWFQVSGFRCQEGSSTEGTIHHLRHTLLFPQLTCSGVLTLGLSSPMFSPIHSTYECILWTDPEFLNTPFYKSQDLSRPYNCYGSPRFPFNPEPWHLTSKNASESRFVHRQGWAFTNGLVLYPRLMEYQATKILTCFYFKRICYQKFKNHCIYELIDYKIFLKIFIRG